MTELDEITNGKSLTELQEELKYQLAMGESLGGTICSHILFHLQKEKVNGWSIHT